jgi:ADP-heptose:LPS heptosyltransferase
LAKFLVIRLSSIGDIILTTPVIRCLKNQLKESEIHFLVKKQFLPVISSDPYIDKIHCYENDLSSLLKTLKKEHFDSIIDLHANIRSFIIKTRIRAYSFTVNKINFRKFLMVRFKLNLLPDIHIVDRYLETVRSLGIKNDGRGLDYFIPREDEVNTDSLPPAYRNGYIAVVIGGKHATKQIPADRLILLCKLLSRPVILLGGPDDRVAGEKIAASAGGNVLNACGNYNINQSAFIVANSLLVITNDTGLMHVAAAFHKIILSVWGNTIPEFGMSPYLPDPLSRIFEVKGLYCRPCSKIGYKKCPRHHFRCMLDQDIKEIADTAISLFSKDRSDALL